MTNTVLFVDDDVQVVHQLAANLRLGSESAVAIFAKSIEEGLELQREKRPSVAVLDLSIDRSGPAGGFRLLQEIVSRDKACRCIVLTGHGGNEYGIQALSLGAANFCVKPADPQHLRALIIDGFRQSALLRELERLRAENQSSISTRIIGVSAAAEKLRKEIQEAAATEQHTLITGETGTGKSVAAKAIHQLSSRRNGPFCVYAQSVSTTEHVISELFGHVKGAFTGALKERDGLLTKANNGTLLLDDFDLLPPQNQGSLLRAIQDGVYSVMGGDERSSDYRLICATNADCEAKMRSGELRKDFYHRISGLKIVLPPLRNRREDIEPLVAHILAELNAKGQAGNLDLADASMDALRSYAWPGNIRELEDVIETAAHKAGFRGRSTILPEDLSFLSAEGVVSAGEELSFHEAVELYRLELIQRALKKTNGNISEAARQLGLDRTVIQRTLTKHGKSAKDS